MKKLTTTLVVLAVASASALLAREAVRADAPIGQFTLAGGTVRDNETGLVWQPDVSSDAMLFDEAVTYCGELTLAGGGWRLPAVLELRSLVDETREYPALDDSAFPHDVEVPLEVWSATALHEGFDRQWVVDFGDGSIRNLFTTGATRARVRCVR